MKTIELQTRVPGMPRPQGSVKPMFNKKSGTGFVKYADATIEHRNYVVHWLQQMWLKPEITEAVTVVVTFAFERPKSHYRTGKNSAMLKDDAPEFHLQAPDTDKLQRLVGDALEQSGVLMNDSQIVGWIASKTWIGRGDEAGTSIAVMTR